MAAEEAKQQNTGKTQIEKQTNCLICNKPLKRLTRYYRNGKFYCSKKCWKKSTQVKKEGNDKD